MMTFKDLKKLVELLSYKEQRVPTVKALEVSGVPVVTEKVLENHGGILLILNVHPACLVRENAAEIWGRNGLGQNGKAQITADTMRRSVERCSVVGMYCYL